MTDIPGTQMPKPFTPPAKPSIDLKTKMPLTMLPVRNEVMQVTNTEEEIKTDTKNIEEVEETVWYQTLLAWMTFGTILGVLASLVGFRFDRILTVAPLGPTLGTIAWYVKKFAKEKLKKFDVLH